MACLLYQRSEKGTLVVSAFRCFRQADVDMEYVSNSLVAVLAVAIHSGFDTLSRKIVSHRFGALTKGIMAGGGNVGRGEVPCDVLQHHQSGIIRRDLSA